MSARATFGDWLRETREAHGYSQSALAAELEMARTYVVNLERTQTWPQPDTRARFHAVFGTSDEDIVAFGAATRREYARAGKPPRIAYEPTVRRGDPPPAPVTPSLAGVPPELADMLGRIAWTPDHVAALEPVLRMLVRSTEALSAPAPAGTPAAPPPAAAPSGRSEGR